MYNKIIGVQDNEVKRSQTINVISEASASSEGDTTSKVYFKSGQIHSKNSTGSIFNNCTKTRKCKDQDHVENVSHMNRSNSCTCIIFKGVMNARGVAT